jgi:hypothetical protein
MPIGIAIGLIFSVGKRTTKPFATIPRTIPSTSTFVEHEAADAGLAVEDRLNRVPALLRGLDLELDPERRDARCHQDPAAGRLQLQRPADRVVARLDAAAHHLLDVEVAACGAGQVPAVPLESNRGLAAARGDPDGQGQLHRVALEVHVRPRCPELPADTVDRHVEVVSADGDDLPDGAALLRFEVRQLQRDLVDESRAHRLDQPPREAGRHADPHRGLRHRPRPLVSGQEPVQANPQLAALPLQPGDLEPDLLGRGPVLAATGTDRSG